MSQQAIDFSAILGFVRNQTYFYRQRNPVSLALPTAIASPGDGAYAQFRGAFTTGQTVVAKREKNQSIVSYAMEFLNAVGVHNDTIMVVQSRNLEVHRAAKSSID
eukprot:2397669-Pleurochrysis_carterae.AAC.1